jgi:hypothetical protein
LGRSVEKQVFQWVCLEEMVAHTRLVFQLNRIAVAAVLASFEWVVLAEAGILGLEHTAVLESEQVDPDTRDTPVVPGNLAESRQEPLGKPFQAVVAFLEAFVQSYLQEQG